MEEIADVQLYPMFAVLAHPILVLYDFLCSQSSTENIGTSLLTIYWPVANFEVHPELI